MRSILKSYKKLSLIIFALALGVQISFAQNSSTVYSEDSSSIIVSEYDQMYQLLLPEKKKIYTLIKFNAVDWGLLHPSIIVEQNMNGAFNVEPIVKLAYFDWTFEEGIHYALQAGIDFKYYYNNKRRLRLGKKTNGFVGNYFALGGKATLSDSKDYLSTLMKDQNIGFEEPLTGNIFHIYSAEAKYGIQRRIGNVGYLDVQTGFRYIHVLQYGQNVVPFLRIGIGFGLTKDKFGDLIK